MRGQFDASQSRACDLLQRLNMNAETTSEPDRFRTHYDANYDRVDRLLGRIAGPHDAEDLTQIVFAKTATALPRFRGDAQASTWLYRIAANAASDWLRGRAAREAKLTGHLPKVTDNETGPAHANSAITDRQSSPAQRLVRKEMHDHICREIGNLPEGSREVLILGQLGGL
jgi:RNA polymerase sigma factor (sigma-70 family)